MVDTGSAAGSSAKVVGLGRGWAGALSPACIRGTNCVSSPAGLLTYCCLLGAGTAAKVDSDSERHNVKIGQMRGCDNSFLCFSGGR